MSRAGKPKNKAGEKGINILKSSLYGFPIQKIDICKGNAIVTLFGSKKDFMKAIFQTTDLPMNKLTHEIVEHFKDNYGNGAADGWMESDIYLEDKYELWLSLNKIIVNDKQVIDVDY